MADDLDRFIDEVDRGNLRAATNVSGDVSGHERQRVVHFVHSDAGRIAMHRWAVQDAEAIGKLQRRVSYLEMPWWKRWFTATGRMRRKIIRIDAQL